MAHMLRERACRTRPDACDYGAVKAPVELETTALGAAFLAGLAAGVWRDLESVAATWQKAADFSPSMPAARRAGLIAGWRQAIERTLLAAAVRP